MISPLYAANNLIKRANEQGVNLTNLKLQKLLYILYARYYFDVKAALFPDRFEAWQYGPVLTNVYDIFKVEGSDPIVEMRPDPNGNILIVSEAGKFGSSFDRVWEDYAHKSASYLVGLTHGLEAPVGGILDTKYKTAWRKAYEYHGLGSFIDDDDIKKDGVVWFGEYNH